MNERRSTGSEYVPISCDTYSELELLILRRRDVRLSWTEHNVLYDQVVRPLDLQTVAHQEFLRVRLSNGEERRIRLDGIRRVG